MALRATTTTTTEIVLKPSVKRRLTTELRAYAADKALLKALEEKIDRRKSTIGAIREEAGVNSLSVDGFKVTQICGTTSSIDKQKLVELGCAMAWIEEATVTRPKRPYEKISCPGEKED